MTQTEKLTSFYSALGELYQLRSVQSLLHWDRSVCMPKAGAAGRAAQNQLLSTIIHARRTDERFSSLVFELESIADTLNQRDRVNVRESARVIRRAAKLPKSFVAARSLARSQCHDIWEHNRHSADFSTVKDALTEVIRLVKEESALVGFIEHPYDALLDLYEPGMLYSQVGPELEALGRELSPLLNSIVESNAGQTRDSLPPMSVESQLEFCKRVTAALGFSFESGRLDTTAHPFASSPGPNDVRITTRFDTNDFLSGLYSTLHEVGHAFYELGLAQDELGTPCGSSASLGVHESQSRFWENVLGRSRAFVEFLFRELTAHDPQIAQRCSSDLLWQHANTVERSLIRVEADEVSYSLHIVVRMLLEEKLITGTLTAAELPEAWDELYESLLGVRPANASQGVLQDVHWYQGSFGYFPTYALGNIYAAMFTEQLEAQLGPLAQIADSGNFQPLRAWLGQHIHHFGMQLPPRALIEQAAKRPYSRAPFISYIRHKFNVT